MKRLMLLLPIYLLILSCMPCADIEDGTVSSVQAAITKQPVQGHDNESETCSPFCSCNCCGQRASTPQSFSATTHPIVNTALNQTSLQFFALQSVLHNIWQPPQLV